ncbi:cytochrome P450 3A24-like [Protobothrops mucrosquamatus]|uniref:cytochrome P450 3A24-like n=1 Tax=Protobothrops mucrosquamatus TaxID=103944 RepID=UPI0007757470|nr:cytochrome P450 3A24-like [Protobothrops mucrosquamatus]
MGDPVLGWALGTWALLLLLLALGLLYGTWPYNFFKKLGIPGPRPLPFIGSFHEYRHGILQFDQICFERYGKLWGLFDGRQPVMAILDPALIKSVLVKEFHTYFTNRRNFGLNGDLDTAIFFTVNEQWKRIRNTWSPSFTSGRLKEMLPIINHYHEILVKNLQKKVDNDEVMDMRLIFSAYSLDVVTSTSFGINVDSLNHPNDPVVVNIKKILNFSFLNPILILTVLFPFLTPVLEKLNFSVFPKSSIDFFNGVVKKIKEDRQKENHTNRVDFLQLMVDSQAAANTSGEANSEKALTDKEILAQSIIFIFGGYDTIGITLSFVSYCLATHPDVQEKLYQEINETFPNQAPPTYEAIQHMEYLDMVVNETFRLYPPAERLDRVCKKTVEIHGVTIPEGTVVVVPVFVLHRVPEYWPEPEEFRPERFSKENKESRDPYVFLPFGAGPRNCIAMRFALLVLKMGLVVVLQKIRFQTCKETTIPLELDNRGFVQPKNPIKLKLLPRTVVEHEE